MVRNSKIRKKICTTQTGKHASHASIFQDGKMDTSWSSSTASSMPATSLNLTPVEPWKDRLSK